MSPKWRVPHPEDAAIMSKVKPSPLPPDTLIGGYKVVKKLSAGGFGLVYLALMVSDLQVASDQETVGQLFLRQYAAVPLFLSITLVWTQRYWQALLQSERLSHNLQDQVEVQRAQ